MELPAFPDFEEIDLAFRDVINDYLARFPLEASEYTFTNLFAFRDSYNFKLAQLKNNLIMFKDTEPGSFFCPVGSTGVSRILDDLFDYLDYYGGSHVVERVPESFVKEHIEGDERFAAEEDRDNFDYLYDVRELMELKGRKFHDKKNKVNKFKNAYRYEYEPLTPGLVGECLEFEHHWCEKRECEKYYGLHKERCAILEMLKNFSTLGIKGGVIRVDGKISALTLGEKLLPDTFVIHIEKAHAEIPGLYQVINQEFLQHEAADCTFVNREQDLGVSGLRNSKMSYNPVKFIKKFRVTRRRKR